LDYQVRTTTSASFLARVSLTGELRACSRGKAGGMIMNAKLLLQFSADRRKKSAQSFCRLRRQTALWV
jgi:hypothetical protein